MPSANDSPEVKTTQKAATSVPTTTKKPMPTVVKVLLLVFASFVVLVPLFIFLVFKFINSATQPAVDVSNQVVNSIQADNPSAFYALGSEAFKKTTTQEDVTSVLSTISPALQGNEKVIAKNVQTNNGSSFGAVVYTINTSAGTKYVRVVVQKEGDTWKLYNFKSSTTPLEATIE